MLFIFLLYFLNGKITYKVLKHETNFSHCWVFNMCNVDGVKPC